MDPPTTTPRNLSTPGGARHAVAQPMLAACTTLLLAACGGPWPPLPPDSSCHDDFSLYDSGDTAMFCMGDPADEWDTVPDDARRLVLCDARLADPEPLRRLQKLEHLILYGMQSLPPLEVLGSLPNLRKLDLSGAQLEDWSFLLLLRNLDTLILRGANLPDLTFAAGLTKLESLDVGGAPVRDLAPLRNLVNLRVLKLPGSPVADLTPLALLGNLEVLWLTSTQVTDLGPLAALGGLRALRLEYTQVDDLTPLHGLTLLRQVSLYMVPVSFEQRYALEQAVNGPDPPEDDYLIADIASLGDMSAYCPINRWRGED